MDQCSDTLIDHDAGSVDVANGCHCRARDSARYVRCAPISRTGHYADPKQAGFLAWTSKHCFRH